MSLTWFRVRLKFQFAGRLRQDDLVVVPRLVNKTIATTPHPAPMPHSCDTRTEGQGSLQVHTLGQHSIVQP